MRKANREAITYNTEHGYYKLLGTVSYKLILLLLRNIRKTLIDLAKPRLDQVSRERLLGQLEEINNKLLAC